MAEQPELYWKVRVQEGSSTRFEYLTQMQIETRRSLRNVIPGEISEVNAYVKIGPANYESLVSWKRRQRGR
ncbi:MAG: hypothetical protein Q7S29_03940 [Candidatus Peribacter sp.]|nr:hypothetical protein [Candidatus Peribacter sp.]